MNMKAIHRRLMKLETHSSQVLESFTARSVRLLRATRERAGRNVDVDRCSYPAGTTIREILIAGRPFTRQA
jgi:hypothetical protein